MLYKIILYIFLQYIIVKILIHYKFYPPIYILDEDLIR